MTTYEQNANAFEALLREFGSSPDPTYSEADTRVKIIDAILTKALGWSEQNLRREEHVHQGYIDYTAHVGTKRMLIEAKRIGHTFALPPTIDYYKNLTVKNLLQKQRDLHLMYDQVTRYAHERSVPFCVLTNGTQWLAFPGVRLDAIHLRQSRVIAFNGTESLRDNFLDFWNLLSRESVESGSLEQALLSDVPQIEPSFVYNAEGRSQIAYDRNHLALPLMDVLPKYFGDLHGDPAKSEMLRECFVQEPVRDALRALAGDADSEEPSKTLTSGSPVLHFYALPQVSDKLDALIDVFLKENRDTHFQVLLGRVGIGKTTFLAHFFDIHRRSLSVDNYVIRLDLQQATESTDLEAFFADATWEALTTHPRFSALIAPVTLRQIFKSDIQIMEQGPLSRLKKRAPEEFEDEISKMLARLLQDHGAFVKALAKFLYRDKSGRFVFVFDNVDQLDLDIQERVIRFAFAKMKEYHAFTILSMWEETYFASKGAGRTLSTMRTVPMQITRQSITSVLVKRLQYLILQIDTGSESLALLDEEQCDRETFSDFIRLILESLLVRNRRVRTFLELVGLGNIRRALEMFAAFLTAGSLETRKIVDFMHGSEDYRVPVHEFIKCVMLGSKRYYSEGTSDIINLFAIGDVEHPSHFTRLRILQWLYERRHEASPFGSGLMPITRVVPYFKNLGASERDVDFSLRRLTEGGLVENDLRARKNLERAQAVRITGAGRYYLISLHRMFPYVDLAMQDTPFFDRETFDQIAPLCEEKNMNDRVERCRLFLMYLQDQEAEELLAIDKLSSETTWRRQFVPMMKSHCESTFKDILQRLERSGR